MGLPQLTQSLHMDHDFLFQWTPKREKFLETHNSGDIWDATGTPEPGASFLRGALSERGPTSGLMTMASSEVMESGL